MYNTLEVRLTGKVKRVGVVVVLGVDSGVMGDGTDTLHINSCSVHTAHILTLQTVNYMYHVSYSTYTQKEKTIMLLSISADSDTLSRLCTSLMSRGLSCVTKQMWVTTPL